MKPLPIGQEEVDGHRYGCHCDLFDGQEPDGCVIDTDDHWACNYATFKGGRKRRNKWTCDFWKRVQQ